MTGKELQEILMSHLEAQKVEVSDDSAKHRGHKGNVSGGGHFHVLIVASTFQGKTRIERHRMIYEALGTRMQNDVHALSIEAFTPEEFEEKQKGREI